MSKIKGRTVNQCWPIFKVHPSTPPSIPYKHLSTKHAFKDRCPFFINKLMHTYVIKIWHISDHQRNWMFVISRKHFHPVHRYSFLSTVVRSLTPIDLLLLRRKKNWLYILHIWKKGWSRKISFHQQHWFHLCWVWQSYFSVSKMCPTKP